MSTIMTKLKDFISEINTEFKSSKESFYGEFSLPVINIETGKCKLLKFWYDGNTSIIDNYRTCYIFISKEIGYDYDLDFDYENSNYTIEKSLNQFLLSNNYRIMDIGELEFSELLNDLSYDKLTNRSHIYRNTTLEENISYLTTNIIKIIHYLECKFYNLPKSKYLDNLLKVEDLVYRDIEMRGLCDLTNIPFNFSYKWNLCSDMNIGVKFVVNDLANPWFEIGFYKLDTKDEMSYIYLNLNVDGINLSGIYTLFIEIMNEHSIRINKELN